MFRVSDHLQDYIKRYFQEGRFRSQEVPRSLFTKSDLERGLEPIRVNLSDLGILPSNYARIDAAVQEIFRLTVRVPRVDENGTKELVWFPVFSKASLPITDNGFHYTNDAGVFIESVKKCGYMEFEINPHVASYAFDMSLGYINHPQRIAQISKADCTPLIYALLKRNCFLNKQSWGRAEITPNALREHLGLVYRDSEKNITGYMYEKYNKLKSGIIQKAQKDLQRLADLDKIDYTFTFEEKRRVGKSTGDPLFIVFTMHKTRLGEARDSIQHRNSAERKLVKALTDYCPDLRAADLKNIIGRVGDELFVAFSLYAYKDVRAIIEKKQPDDVAAYILALLSGWVKNHEQQPDLFSAAGVPIEQNEQKEEAKNSMQVLGEYREEWARFLAAYDGPFKTILSKTKHMGSDKGFMWIEFPDKESLDAFEAMERAANHKAEVMQMMAALASVLPKGHGRILVRSVSKK